MPKPRHLQQTYVRATRERVWEALTDPEEVRRYHFGRPDAPLVAGQPYALRQDGEIVVEGTVTSLEPPALMVVTFSARYDPEASTEDPTTVTWELESVGPELTLVRIVHEDFGGLSRTWALAELAWRRIADGLKTWLEQGTELGLPVRTQPGAVTPVDLSAKEHRERGIELYNETWRYLGMEDRGEEDGELMLRCAFASAYHWSQAEGRTLVNDVRSDWQLARVLTVLGRTTEALRYASRCLDGTRRAELQDFDLAYAHEAMARALACAGRDDEARAELAVARAVTIADEQDLEILNGDLDAGPWFGLTGEVSTSGG
ncbi:MAG: SRPBCC domain-containing protein [Ilumatobacteraceae bacterium]